MTAPHVPSDNAAIEAAHAKIRETADLRLLTVVAEFIARPARYNREKVLGAMQAVEDEHYAEMERALGRAPGSLGRPSGRVEAWDHGPGGEKCRGSFAGLTRGPDGTLEPAPQECPKCKAVGWVGKCRAWADCPNPIRDPLEPNPYDAGFGLHPAGWLGKPPAGGVTVATVPANKALRKACEHRVPLDEATTPSGHPLSDQTKAAIREFVRRPETAFGPPFTVYSDTGPIVPVDPTIAAKDSA